MNNNINQDTTGFESLDKIVDSKEFIGFTEFISIPFSFDRYLIWGLMKFIHFFAQTIGFFMFLDFAEKNYLISGDTNKFFVWICYFLIVRTIFEFIGVIFSINGKLQDMLETLKNIKEK